MIAPFMARLTQYLNYLFIIHRRASPYRGL